MNKKMIKILALVTACSAALTIGITHIDNYNEKDIIDYMKDQDVTISTTYDEPEATTQPTIETTQQEETNSSTSEVEKTETETKPTVEETKPVQGVPNVSDNLVIYTTTDVNLRSSTSTDSFKIGNLKLGESAIKILSTNGWELVNYNGTLGYVKDDYVQYTDQKVDDGYEHTLKNDIVLTNTDLNFRNEPTTDGKKLDTLEPNTELQVIAEVDNGWLLVRHNGTLGYVKASYTTSLLDKLNSTYPGLNLDELEIEGVVYNNATKLNLRQEPSTESTIIGEFERYETMRVIKETDEWSLIMTNDYNFGFVFKEYTRELDGIFITVDKGEQRLVMYNDNEVLISTPVTTGKDSTPSDTGYFSIYSKERDRYLTGPGYRSFVEYWMPYNGGEGIHDASWRSVFGTESYHTSGSHGCINTPKEAVSKIWEKAVIGTKVLVHK